LIGPGGRRKICGIGIARHISVAAAVHPEGPGVAPGARDSHSPAEEIDAALVEAISQRWFTLLDERDYASDSRGKVVLQFALHYDGRVSDMNMAENTTGEVLGLICQKAVLDPAPFAAWPSDMRRILGDVRHIQFTFYYY